VLIGSLITTACTPSSDSPTIARQELIAEVRIGSEVRGPAYAFSEISQIAARRDAIYVVQNGVPEIRVFDAKGQNLRTIGRRGAGPGEFDAVQSFGLLADTLWVIDSNLRRLSFFSATGALLTTIPFEPISPELGAKGRFYFSYPMALMGDGSMLGFGGSTGRAIADGLVTATPLLRMTRTGRTLDTLGWVPIGNENMILRSAKGGMYRTQPFSDGSLTAYSSVAQRLFVVDRRTATEAAKPTVRVTALRANGDTAWSRTYPYTPVRMGAAVVDSVRAGLHQALRGRFTGDEIDRVLYVPVYRPPIAAAFAGDDGTLWLRWEEMTAPNLYWVLGTDGRVVAQVTAPPRVRLRWTSGSTAWGEELDENDVPTLVRYRIESAK
jgi:hypothetical protein